MKVFYYILFLIVPLPLCSQYLVDYNEEFKSAYTSIINLEFTEAQEKIAAFKNNEPLNLAYLHLENYYDFFQMFIYEDQIFFEQAKEEKNRRISLLNELEDKDPYKKFVKAEINLQWALSRSKFDEIFKAGTEIYTAYKLLRDNQEAFPDFIYNYKSLSVIHSLVETVKIPGLFKSLFGVDGSIALGLEEIESLLVSSENINFPFVLEAEAIYMFMLLYQDNNPGKALIYLRDSALEKDKSPLSSFVKVKLLQRSGNNDQAIEILSNTLENTAVTKFPYLYFLMGSSKLRKLEPEAISYLQEYIDYFQGLHYIKEAYQKLAWSSLVFYKSSVDYKKAMVLCERNGNALIDDDKQALREAESGLVPNPDLLKARLLFDGGYFAKAYQIMITSSDLQELAESNKLEYYYRLGRITQALANYPEAIQYYYQTQATDPNNVSYMSCNAALQLGLIYEAQREYDTAEEHFNSCLGKWPIQYRASLHQKAKSGLDRLKALRK